MPLYDWKCICENEFEFSVSLSDVEKHDKDHTLDIVKCPKCGSNNVSRTISPLKTQSQTWKHWRT